MRSGSVQWLVSAEGDAGRVQLAVLQSRVLPVACLPACRLARDVRGAFSCACARATEDERNIVLSAGYNDIE
eukprot:7211286-Lingulodinium_polyedra.AAC.1